MPTSSTCEQLAIGDCLAVAAINKKRFSKQNFKEFHPSGSLGAKLKTVEDLMITGKKIPFIDENSSMKKALSLITKKKLGILIVVNKKKITTGIITDGQIRRSTQKNNSVISLSVKKVMTKNPISVDKDMLAVKSLSIMSENKITSLCVHKKNKTKKTIGVLHIHYLLDGNIS